MACVGNGSCLEVWANKSNAYLPTAGAWMLRCRGDRDVVVTIIWQATGTIDERIYQRQISKTELADTVVDSKVADRNFAANDLKQLFQYDPTCSSTTAQLMQLKYREGGDSTMLSKHSGGWGNYDPTTLPCPIMQRVGASNAVSFIHYRTNQENQKSTATSTAPCEFGACMDPDTTDPDDEDVDLELDSDFED